MFSKRLGELREKSGLTQKELSSRLGMARTTYSGYENGAREPDHQTLQKFADFFDVSIDYLLGRTNEKIRESKNYDTDNTDDKKKHPGEILLEYIEQGLTNEQLKKRGDLYVAFLALNDDQADEFLNFAREQIFKNLKQPTAALSESEEP